MKQLTVPLLLALVSLPGFSQDLIAVMVQDYPNVRIMESQSSIYKKFGEAKESGFAGNMQYRSHFIFEEEDSLCVEQRTLFFTNSIAQVDSLLRKMNFIKKGELYFAYTEDVEIEAYIDPEVIVVDKKLSFVDVQITVRYEYYEEEPELERRM